MPVRLLDVNVLVALACPRHVHHGAAWGWFDACAGDPFATCPMTQCGFVRISSNPKVVQEVRGLGEAVASLGRIVGHPRHVFWEDSIALSDAPTDRVMGHRQVTDAYLLGLALANGGRFATFDRGVVELARDDGELAAVEIIAG